MLVGENFRPHDVVLRHICRYRKARSQSVGHPHLLVQVHDLVMVVFRLQLFADALRVEIVILNRHLDLFSRSGWTNILFRISKLMITTFSSSSNILNQN